MLCLVLMVSPGARSASTCTEVRLLRIKPSDTAPMVGMMVLVV